MNEYPNHVNKIYGKSRISSSSFDENLHSNSTGTFFSSQTFVDDIPFEFNSKYRIIRVPNIQFPDYDTQTIQNLLSTSFDFSLEKRVLEEAIEDVQRKKKEIEADSLVEPTSKTSKTLKPNCQVSDSSSISPSRHSESVPLPIVLPTIPHPPPSIPPPNPISSSSSSAIVSLPSSSTVPSFPSIHPSTHSSYSSPTNSFRLPSVRDIYWPTTNQQQYQIPSSTGHPLSITSNPYPISVPTAIPHPPIASIPPPLRLPPPSLPFNPPMISKPMTTTTITPLSSSGLTPTSISTSTSTSTSVKNSINTNELAVTFDQTLTSDDPFHDAELKSLNDVVELNHLYSVFGSANTVRR